MLHLLTGYTLKMVKKIREGLKAGVAKKERAWLIFDGICDALFIYTLFVGIGFLAVPMVAPMIVEGFDPAALNGFPFSSIGMTLLLVTVGGILLTAGRESLRKKKIGGYITSGLSGLYGLVSLFSDILSYSRLFGLALSGAAIGMAFNLIGSMLFGLAPVVGYIVGGLVLAVLHLFNFALSALGAYVHNIRLQYLEFYGKFYDGGGRMFAPLGENTKYVRFVNKGKVASKK